ncbi:hypothetical protein UDZ25_09090 [Serratia marcescens]|uniref:DUF6953 family protein n=1 Tax=Serratia TaxID=613 RepID=UPI0039BEEBB7
MTLQSQLESIVKWMVTTVNTQEILYQHEVVDHIITYYGDGDDFVNMNDQGNYGINRKILALFRKASEKDVVWDREDKAWRLRYESDLPGRQQ